MSFAVTVTSVCMSLSLLCFSPSVIVCFRENVHAKILRLYFVIGILKMDLWFLVKSFVLFMPISMAA